MGKRVTVTARQARLGAELRRMREVAGLSVREAAERLGIDQTKISHMEAARTGVGAERLRRMASAYACLDTAYIDALVGMTGDRPRQWWDAYRGRLPQSALDLAELEYRARGLAVLQAAYVPGQLQTEDYMASVLSYSIPQPPPQQLEVLVSFRLRRQQVLDRDPALRFRAVIHESALRTRVADRRAAHEQLLHILEQSDRPNVTVQVVPFETEGFGGAGYSILYAEGHVDRLDTVHIDALPAAVWLDAEAQLVKYRAIMEKVAGSSLPPAKSRDFIHRLAQEL